jgi:hypothetical protein
MHVRRDEVFLSSVKWRHSLVLTLTVSATLGCGSASLVKAPNDGGAGAGGRGIDGGGAGGGAGRNPSGSDGGTDRARSMDAGCSDDAGICGGYTCASASACGSSCTANAGCVSGYTCLTGSCIASAFVSGPCVTVLPGVSPNNDYATAVVFGRGNDVKLHQRINNGTSWGSWATVSVDVSVLDVRSDLDCGTDNGGATHIVATGANPLGAVMHATGSGTTFNGFIREFSSQTFITPGAAIAFYPYSYNYLIGALGPIVDSVSNGVSTEITPITTLTNALTSAIDVAYIPPGGLRMLVAFDSSGQLATYGDYFPSSAPPYWASPQLIQPPNGTNFSFSPTICGDDGLMADSVIHVVAVASGQVWDTWTPDYGTAFSAWERIGTQAASAPDCTMMGDESVHVVVLNSVGHILDINGSPGTWATTDLGTF